MKIVLALAIVLSSAFAVTSNAAPLVCKEGSVANFPEIQSNGKYKDVYRTCVNGRFFPKAAPVTALVCKEGSQQLFSEIQSNGKYKDVWRTCVNGRFYPKSNVVTPVPCKEGYEAFSLVRAANGDDFVDVLFACKNGKWRPKY